MNRSVQDQLASANDLGRRIAIERQARGWSYGQLATRMTDAGCAMPKVALVRIEQGNGPGKPPRQVSVRELVALAAVFDLSIENLLIPIELVEKERAQALVAANRMILGRLMELVDQWLQCSYEMWLLRKENPEMGEWMDGHVGHSLTGELDTKYAIPRAALEPLVALHKSVNRAGYAEAYGEPYPEDWDDADADEEN